MQREQSFNEKKSLCSKIVVTEFVAEATSPVKEWHDLRQKQNNGNFPARVLATLLSGTCHFDSFVLVGTPKRIVQPFIFTIQNTLAFQVLHHAWRLPSVQSTKLPDRSKEYFIIIFPGQIHDHCHHVSPWHLHRHYSHNNEMQKQNYSQRSAQITWITRLERIYWRMWITRPFTLWLKPSWLQKNKWWLKIHCFLNETNRIKSSTPEFFV